jgi:nucleotide-binding universal stress UspA family protein
MVILAAAGNDALQERVLAVALRLADDRGEELRVVHLVDESVSAADADRLADRLRERLVGEDVVSTVAVERVDRTPGRSHARIGRALSELTAADDVSHVVVGHASKEFAESLLRGNAAFAVAEDARVPVTVVPDGVGRDGAST